VKNKLNVFVNQLKVGELWLDQQRRFCFQYENASKEKLITFK